MSIEALASLGCKGRHPQNVERDLHRWTSGLHGCALQVKYVQLDLLVPGEDEPQPVQWPIISPETWMHALHNDGPHRMALSECGHN